jgi:hypothetical protein
MTATQQPHMGVAELADLLGVSRQRASTISKHQDFPAPVSRLAQGPVWDTAVIQAWATTWRRKRAASPRGGRPRTRPVPPVAP